MPAKPADNTDAVLLQKYGFWLLAGYAIYFWATTFIRKFEQALKSGRIEADFEFGNEQQRYDILELLQKLMDVADTADEVASKIIYRGLQKPREA